MKHSVVIVEDDPSDHSNFQEKIDEKVVKKEKQQGYKTL